MSIVCFPHVDHKMLEPGWKGWKRDSLITTTAPSPPLALIPCPNIFHRRGHSHSNSHHLFLNLSFSSKGLRRWKYLIEKAGNSVAWFVDIWKFIGICLNRSEVVEMRGKRQNFSPNLTRTFEFSAASAKLFSEKYLNHRDLPPTNYL